MSVGEYCNREVIVVASDEPVRVAAELMRRRHVGDVVVIEEQDGLTVPTGIVTDRDLVVEVMAPGLSPDELRVQDIVTEPLLTARESDSLPETLAHMRRRGVRRAPVVGDDGGLVGILTVDDIIG
ncbi:MAG: CBS domain-containing protein, partial [Gammaproteobacteria bacterium]|nr:CBS domain-containing protein [Gammaproteobacteria bacterium]